MNKNERRKRAKAAKGIDAFNMYREYDKTTNNGHPTERSLVRRAIATKHMPRLSHKPKVAASARSITERIGRS